MSETMAGTGISTSPSPSKLKIYIRTLSNLRTVQIGEGKKKVTMTEERWASFVEMTEKSSRDFEKQITAAEARGQPLSRSLIAQEYERLRSQITRQQSNHSTYEKIILKHAYGDPPTSHTASPLVPAFQKHLQFYCDYLEPFLHRYSERAENQPDPTFGVRPTTSDDGVTLFTGIAYEIYLRYIGCIHFLATFKFRRRHEAGLMRDSQLAIVRIALRSHEDTLKALIEKDAPGGRALVEVLSEILRHRNLVLRFIGSQEFRSERLETLLMRYLGEDGVDMELVKTLDEINDDNIPDALLEKHPIIKKLNPDMPYRREDQLGELLTFQTKEAAIKALELANKERRFRQAAQMRLGM
ncbi:hypothetical protein BJ508DRAFT_141911 [Ascobolus immersus RN42]|uniref:Uncharacterized protein n=1 Tax=Ascobolus immersus RN42 TaxID=1160509 RepID=A0A3N4HZP9_ASCIM|nr:hypothetical protein BJ508DRAFT_141911 [Ascobolus immersus RN42]